MQLRRALTTVLVALCCVNDVVAHQILNERQPTTNGNNSPSPSPSSPSSQTTIHSPSHTSRGTPSTSGQSSVTSTSPSTTTKEPSSTTNTDKHASVTSSLSTTTPGSNQPTATPISKAKDEDTLPLTPELTPAVGLAGVILLISGLALALIGIKHKVVHIFLSSALLTSLAVTVLILYLMSPPVSNAIQGAYFVAAFVTGLLFGGASLIFKEVTESLACLLGGFCVSMWFLVLSPGGLVQSTTGKAVMIAVFCVAGWSLAFSHYTRNYGLIVSTSFGGATAAVIGVDCFSRAGLVQFWIYLWNLNENEFPLHTTTYPITRGIRVEIAVIIIVFLFGLMSQFKIWKIVKERRERAAMDRIRDLESRDQHDEDAGRKVEASNERELAQWEAQYGGKDKAMTNADSGIGSSVISFQKRSTSVTENEIDSIEMNDISREISSKRESKQDPRTTITVNIAPDEDWARIRPTSISQQNLLEPTDDPNRRSQASYTTTQPPPSEQMYSTSVRDGVDRSDLPPVPPVIPLPFSLPAETNDDDRSDRGSVGSHGTAGQEVNERPGMRLSLSSLKKHVSMQRTSVPRIEEDRASSIFAIADGESDTDAVSAGRRSPFVPSPLLEPTKGGLIVPSDGSISRPLSYAGSATAENPVEEVDDEALVRPEPIVQKPATPPPPPELILKQSERQSAITSRRKSKSIGSVRTSWDGAAKSEKEGSPSVIENLNVNLPEKLSKVAMAYRTNEWAKHIADADQPEAEDLPESHSPGIQVDRAFAEESARSIDPAALVGGIVEEPAEISRKVSKATTNPYRKSREVVQTQRQSSAPTPTPVYAFHRSTSQISLQRQSSGSSIANAAAPPPKLQQRLSQRNSSAPMLAQEPLVESPIEETLAAPPPVRNFSSPLNTSNSTNNLLDERSTRLKRKTTTTSFNAITPGPSVNALAPGDSASIREISVEDPGGDHRLLRESKQLVDEENMTLAERKSMMQQQARQSQALNDTQQQFIAAGLPPFASPDDRRLPQRQSSHPVFPTPPGATTPAVAQQIARSATIQAHASSSNKNLIYDSHQPKRGAAVDAVKQATMLTQWRASLADEVAAADSQQPQRHAEDNARNTLIAQKQWAAWNKQQAAEAQTKRQSQMEYAMRTGQMQGAHQDVLRRMQAQANRNAHAAEH